jgi:hypothetical protein
MAGFGLSHLAERKNRKGGGQPTWTVPTMFGCRRHR